MKLWHVSETPGINRFEPRSPPSPVAGFSGPVVWAVDEAHLVNYLLPRDCPRVAIRRGSATSAADADRFFGATATSVVIYIEAMWIDRAQNTALWLYELPPATFRLVDGNAGYWVSAVGVAPHATHALASPLDELAQRGAELRPIAQLRPLADAVAASSLAFSIIRLRNAQ